MGTPVWLAFGRQAFGKAGFDSASLRFVKGDLDVDLAGKHMLVTGANSGLGFETAKGLLQRGASVEMLCRSKERADEAAKRLVEETGQPASLLTVHVVDMSDSASVSRRRVAAGTACHVTHPCHSPPKEPIPRGFRAFFAGQIICRGVEQVRQAGCGSGEQCRPHSGGRAGIGTRRHDGVCLCHHGKRDIFADRIIEASEPTHACGNRNWW